MPGNAAAHWFSPCLLWWLQIVPNDPKCLNSKEYHYKISLMVVGKEYLTAQYTVHNKKWKLSQFQRDYIKHPNWVRFPPFLLWLLIKLSNHKTLASNFFTVLKYFANIYYEVSFLYPWWYALLSTWFLNSLQKSWWAHMIEQVKNDVINHCHWYCCRSLLEVKLFTKWLQSSFSVPSTM